MNLKLGLIIFVCITISSCVATKNQNYTFNNKYSADQVQQDLTLLKSILEANHPSLYWYTSKDSLDYYFKETIESIKDSLTEIEAKNKLSFWVSKINCGHTSVKFSKQFLALAEKHKYPQFPLSIKTWKDSMVVLGRYNIEDSMLKRGTIITSINNTSSKDILQKMFNYISTDGYSNNLKSQVISNNFPAWYRNIMGLDSAFRIGYLDSLQQEKFISIKVYQPKKDSSKKKEEKEVVKVSRAEKQARIRSLQIDSSNNNAYIRLSTFSKGNLRTFFRSSFRTIKQNNIQNVVIDLRENGGGSVEKSILLSKYLVKQPFKVGDTIAAKSKKFEYGRYIQGWLPYWFYMQFAAKKMSDGLYHNRRFETHFYQPKSSNHFDGQIYLVQDGFTFSASTMFISSLYQQKNVTTVGEETGGGFYGNSAMLIPTIVLPNTKLKVSLPIYKLVMDKNRPKGKGIMPDVEIYPSSESIKKGLDLKLDSINKMIIEAKISANKKWN